MLEKKMQKAGILESLSDVAQDDVAARWERSIDRLISIMDNPEHLAKLALLVSVAVRIPLMALHPLFVAAPIWIHLTPIQEKVDQ